MINFRYHIVSLVAVFMALAIGITLGATILGDRLNQGIVIQAAQDRKELQDERARNLQLQELNDYRDGYAQKVGVVLTDQLLLGQDVVVVAMPDAPRRVVDDISSAVTASGGTLTATVEVKSNAFDPTRIDDTTPVVDGFADRVGFAANDSLSTKFGKLIARAILSKVPAEQDQLSKDIVTGLSQANLVSVDAAGDRRAQLVIVVTAAAPSTRPAPEILADHVQMAVALKDGPDGAFGVVVAGPNSVDIEGTDVATVRAEASSNETLSTVDVADLPGGVTTVILAAKEQSLGRQGHYGAASRADGVAPELPVR